MLERASTIQIVSMTRRGLCLCWRFRVSVLGRNRNHRVRCVPCPSPVVRLAPPPSPSPLSPLSSLPFSLPSPPPHSLVIAAGRYSKQEFVSVSLSVSMFASVSICARVCVCVCLCACVCVRVSVCACVHALACVYAPARVSARARARGLRFLCSCAFWVGEFQGRSIGARVQHLDQVSSPLLEIWAILALCCAARSVRQNWGNFW